MSDQTALIQVDPPSVIKMHGRQRRSKPGETVGLIPGTAIVPVEYLPPPEYDPRTHAIARAEPVVAPDGVTIGWDVSPLPVERVIANIKAEANEVITQDDRLPIWRQQNIMAASMRSIDERLSGNAGTPSVEEYAKAAYGWVETVRAESNAKEAALIAGEPIDLDDWPEYPL